MSIRPYEMWKATNQTQKHTLKKKKTLLQSVPLFENKVFTSVPMAAGLEQDDL